MVTNSLTVAMNGHKVGQLRRERAGGMSFQYDQSWLDIPSARVISLSLPLRRESYIGELVFRFFQNLLPDSPTVLARIQNRLHIPTQQPFDVLARIGRDCIGAIQLYPDNIDVPSIQQVTAIPLDDIAVAKLIEDYQQSPMGMDDKDDFRISLTGAQEKLALLWYKNQWHRPLGSTPTSHIIKLPIGKIAHNNIDLSKSHENEWLCLQIAKAFGLPVAHADIMQFEQQKVLVVERFDRKWSQDSSWLIRLPQEDMCQALGVAPTNKYEADGGPSIKQIMNLLNGSRTQSEDRRVFFKAQILYWLLAAIDGHGKNFSIFLEPASSYVLTPLYDIMSAYPIFGPQEIAPQKVKMAMALRGKSNQYRWFSIEPRHFMSTARYVGFSRTQAYECMAEMATQTEEVVSRVAKLLPADFSSEVSLTIFSSMLKQAKRLSAFV